MTSGSGPQALSRPFSPTAHLHQAARGLHGHDSHTSPLLDQWPSSGGDEHHEIVQMTKLVLTGQWCHHRRYAPSTVQYHCIVQMYARCFSRPSECASKCTLTISRDLETRTGIPQNPQPARFFSAREVELLLRTVQPFWSNLLSPASGQRKS